MISASTGACSLAGRPSLVEPTAFDEVLLMRISPRKEENDFALLGEKERTFLRSELGVTASEEPARFSKFGF